jgi:hypothetical protein
LKHAIQCTNGLLQTSPSAYEHSGGSGMAAAHSAKVLGAAGSVSNANPVVGATRCPCLHCCCKSGPYEEVALFISMTKTGQPPLALEYIRIYAHHFQPNQESASSICF